EPSPGAVEHLLQADGGALWQEGHHHLDEPELRRLVRLPWSEGNGRGAPRSPPSSLPHDPHRWSVPALPRSCLTTDLPAPRGPGSRQRPGSRRIGDPTRRVAAAEQSLAES